VTKNSLPPLLSILVPTSASKNVEVSIANMILMFLFLLGSRSPATGILQIHTVSTSVINFIGIKKKSKSVYFANCLN